MSSGRVEASTTDRLFAVDGVFGYPSTLYELDPATGAILAEIGPTGFDGMSALDFDPTSGTLYGIVESWSSHSSLLVQIDPESGSGVPIGIIGEALFSDIAFDASGTLYAWERSDALYTIDLSTGAGTKVGDCGCWTQGEQGIAFDSTGTLYLKAWWDMWEIDTSTGQRVLSTNVGLQPYSNDMLAIDANDVFYTGHRWLGDRFVLRTLDPNTGTLTEIGWNPQFLISGLAFTKSTTHTKADVLAGSGVPGKGIDKAPGLQKEFNPNSKAAENAGKKK